MLFPDPRRRELITAPIGPGVYELRRTDTEELILRGSAKNCAYRMTSLLPAPLGQGTRNNAPTRDYVVANLASLAYRCCPCSTKAEARALEARLNREARCRFPT